MAGDITLDQITDFTLGTLKNLGRNRFQQVAQNLQYYPVVSSMFKKGKVEFDEGNGVQRQLMISLSRQARHQGIMATDSVDMPSLMASLSVNFVHATVGWGFSYQEVMANRGEAMIFRVIKPRRADALISLGEELESKAWSAPVSGNNMLPWGIPFWVVFAASSTPDFVGGYPSGFTSLAGLDLSAATKFKNLSCTYTTVSKADLLAKMRTGHRKIGWQAPVSVSDYGRGEYMNLKYYTNEAQLALLEALGEAQNENLGRDLAPFGGPESTKWIDGQITFRRHTIRWVPQLDDTSVFTACTNPIYGIDDATFYPVCASYDYLRETGPLRAPVQHNVYRVFVDLSYNYLCIDRRRNQVYATA